MTEPADTTTPPASPASPRQAPRGFAPIFEGWNVWQVWFTDDPDYGPVDAVMMAGLSLDRQLRILVENFIKEHGAGVAVADPANPAALRGDQIQLIPNPGTLDALQTRAELPEFSGAVQVGEDGSKAVLRTLRFFNRGAAGVVPWMHDANMLLDTVYAPSSANPITNAPAPDSLAGAASQAGEVLKVVGIVAGVALGGVLLINLLQAAGSRRSR